MINAGLGLVGSMSWSIISVAQMERAEYLTNSLVVSSSLTGNDGSGCLLVISSLFPQGRWLVRGRFGSWDENKRRRENRHLYLREET